MLAYRTIGESELNALLFSGNPIYGQAKWQWKWECGCNSSYPYGIVCFFQKPIALKDKKHKFEIVVDLKNPMQGEGVFDVAKDFNKTQIITFRGKKEIKLPELYVRYYTLKDVKAINFKDFYASWYTYNDLKNICDRNGIDFHNANSYHFNLKRRE